MNHTRFGTNMRITEINVRENGQSRETGNIGHTRHKTNNMC